MQHCALRPAAAQDMLQDVTRADGWPRLALGKAALPARSPPTNAAAAAATSVYPGSSLAQRTALGADKPSVRSEESGSKPK